MTVENHPLLRGNPELADQLLARAMADGAFAQRAQRYATLDARVRGSLADADEAAEHAALGKQLIGELQLPVTTSCCGGCGGSAHRG